MAALHGREDPLLEAGRFARLLRQANDAEVADVRKVGEEDYEVSLHRGRGAPTPSQRQQAPVAAPAERSAEPATGNGAAPAPSAAPEQAPAAMRSGLRFRRGSRAPMRTGEIPLIGVVNMEPVEPAPAPSAAAAAPAAASDAAAPSAKRARKPAARSKAAKAPKVATAMESPPAAPDAKPEGKPARKRARPRAKKAE
jgi:hypothetical protein